jgi:hypothetical protein
VDCLCTYCVFNCRAASGDGESLVHKEMEGCGRSVISHNIAEVAETEDNHEKPQAGESVLGSKYDPVTPQIRPKFEAAVLTSYSRCSLLHIVLLINLLRLFPLSQHNMQRLGGDLFPASGEVTLTSKQIHTIKPTQHHRLFIRNNIKYSINQ